MTQTLDSLASAKAKLTEELRLLDQQERDLRKEQSDDAFAQVMSILHLFGRSFDAKQKGEIAALVVAAAPYAKKAVRGSSDVQPKYWLSHTGETWSGRGRPPRSFAAWEGTVSHRE